MVCRQAGNILILLSCLKESKCIIVYSPKIALTDVCITYKVQIAELDHDSERRPKPRSVYDVL
jgi:hypothetical protein